MSYSIVFYALFGYEVMGETSEFWTDAAGFLSNPVIPAGPKYILRETAEFDAWRDTKRVFDAKEVVAGLWVKIGTSGHSFFVKFSPDGKFTERNVFARDNEPDLLGAWNIAGGVLETSIGQYRLYALANKTGSIHSGAEFMKDARNPHAYFKLIHLI